MNSTTNKSLVIALSICAAIGCGAIMPGCTQQASAPEASTPEEQAAPQPTLEETDPELLDVKGSSMSDTLSLDSNDYLNLGWEGSMNLRVESATIYEDYAAAHSKYPGLIASKNASEDSPVLVCEVFLDNSGAVSTEKSGAFKANFMFLGPDRIPVTFFAREGDQESSEQRANDAMEFDLPDSKSTTITVGFTVPQTWFDSSSDVNGLDVNGRDYIAFGGTAEQYHLSVSGEIPDTPFIWLTTKIAENDK